MGLDEILVVNNPSQDLKSSSSSPYLSNMGTSRKIYNDRDEYSSIESSAIGSSNRFEKISSFTSSYSSFSSDIDM